MTSCASSAEASTCCPPGRGYPPDPETPSPCRSAGTGSMKRLGSGMSREVTGRPGADRLVRTYWNCAPSAAPTVVREVTAVLSRHRLTAYRLKTVVATEHPGRADALVLYLGSADHTTTEPDLLDAAARLQRLLRPRTPRWTATSSPGVAWAEGPLDGASFGQSRSDLSPTPPSAWIWKAGGPLKRSRPRSPASSAKPGWTRLAPTSNPRQARAGDRCPGRCRGSHRGSPL